MAIQTRLVDYRNDGSVFEAFMAWDDQISGPRPGVLIAHTIAGRSEHEERKAAQLAELGYVGFAADVYGKGTQSTDFDENRKRMTALLDDRAQSQGHLHVALKALREQSEVEESKLGAIGFCFGGLCVLDMARANEDLAGVVSFHGLLTPGPHTNDDAISPKMLVLHGWDDPLAEPDAVIEFAREVSARNADWQLHAYGNTMHAFTNPNAADPEGGKQFNESADRRSWTAMRVFLAELFD